MLLANMFTRAVTKLTKVICLNAGAKRRVHKILTLCDLFLGGSQILVGVKCNQNSIYSVNIIAQ